MEEIQGKEPFTVEREGEFSYKIYFEQSFDRFRESLQEAGLLGRRICIVTDSLVGPLYEEALRKALEPMKDPVSTFTFPAGEKSKRLDTVQDLYEHLIRHGFERRDVLLALGGGVVGDLTGFAAATYLRGMDFIQIPTTLLAQVDSSIGGKTGVDFLQYKNMVGAFHQPRMVYINLSTLQTLSEETFACGMGEVLKSGLIRDGEYYRWLLEHAQGIREGDFSLRRSMIRRCCEIKRAVVEEDPTEQGVRAILNFGHTIGHSVEKLMDFKLLHGQCVALGNLAAGWISYQKGLISKEDYQEIREGNRLFGLPLKVKGLSPQEVYSATKKDKKMVKGRVRFILLQEIGNAYIDHSLREEEILEGIRQILEGE